MTGARYARQLRPHGERDGWILSLALLPARFERDLAAAVNRLAGDPELAARLGRAGRERAVRDFGWDAVAAQTVELYRGLLS